MEVHLGQDSLWKLLYTSGVCKTVWVKIPGVIYFTFRLRLLVEITLHFWNMEGNLGQILIVKEITIYFWRVEGHLGQDYW